MTDTPYLPRFSDDDTMDYKGKTFVFYDALLREAKAMGLVSLDATWTYNDAGLALASAIAVFADGRRHTEGGDATPENVGSFVKPHFRRMALTRAKARALRDALGVKECSMEELQQGSEDEGKPAPVPQMTGQPSREQPGPRTPTGEVYATALVMTTTRNGTTLYKVLSDDFPDKYTGGQYPGVVIWDNALKASGIAMQDLAHGVLPDIDGWKVEWEEYVDNQGRPQSRVTRLVPQVHGKSDDRADNDDVPF